MVEPWFYLDDLVPFEDFTDMVNLEYDEALALMDEKGFPLLKMDFDERTAEDGRKVGRLHPTGYSTTIDEGWCFVLKADVDMLRKEEPPLFWPVNGERRERQCVECMVNEGKISNLEGEISVLEMTEQDHRDKIEKLRAELETMIAAFEEGEKLISDLGQAIEDGRLVARDEVELKAKMSKAREGKESSTRKLWSDSLKSALWSVSFCLEEHKRTGEPVTKATRNEWLHGKGLPALASEADTIFNRTVKEAFPGCLK